MKKNQAGSGRRQRMLPFDYINYILLGALVLIAFYPMWYVLICSFNEGPDFMAGGIWILPRKFTTLNYHIVFGDAKLWHAFFVTVMKTLIGTFTGLLFTSVVAYSMSRNELKYRNVFYWVNMFTMFFGGGLVPYYLIIRATGLYDSFLVYIIPAMYSVYNMIVISTFFRGIPNDLHEAAIIDGAGEFVTLFTVYLPLAKPILATVGLWLAVGHWNGYFGTMVYTDGGNLTTLQYYLLQLIKQTTAPDNMDAESMEKIVSETVSYAAMVVATIPILCVYPFLQRFFTKGIALGSLKG
ncbi:MAG: carbohydrate ABC transporter permease [Clostridia bacterium]|nr:carbohydrate ABC transporter permease [Clostridia bacterium]